MNRDPFYRSSDLIKKGPLASGERKKEILDFFRIESINDIAAKLCQIPEDDLWNLSREILLALRVRVASENREKQFDANQTSNPYSRAIEYLYILNRFVETAKRFPSKEEQGALFEDLTKAKPLREERLTREVTRLLEEASKTPKSRKARWQLQQRSRRYR